MIVEVITCFYREEFLAPLFKLHYAWADRIQFIVHQRGDGKLDDEDKMNWVNDAIRRSTADWVVLVDMDEFVYPSPWGCNPRVALEQETADMIFSRMTRMWRHHTERDIDRSQPPVPQRLHGQPDHVKPCVFRPAGVTVGAGNHDYQSTHALEIGRPWAGAHWANADQAFWIERETRDRGPRLSERNRQRGHGTHTLRTREQIIAECEAHQNDPQIIFP